MVLPSSLEACGYGDEREGVALAVADFEVVGVFGELRRGEFDGGDEFVGLERGFDVRRAAGEKMEVVKGDGALALWAFDVDGGVERGEGYVHVGGVGGDALIACAEDGVDAVEAFEGRAAAAGVALVAGGEGGVHEVVAAGALEEIAAGGGHVAELRGGSAEQGLREQRVVVCG